LSIERYVEKAEEGSGKKGSGFRRRESKKLLICQRKFFPGVDQFPGSSVFRTEQPGQLPRSGLVARRVDYAE
jgi:hypothetical protein